MQHLVPCEVLKAFPEVWQVVLRGCTVDASQSSADRLTKPGVTAVKIRDTFQVVDTEVCLTDMFKQLPSVQALTVDSEDEDALVCARVASNVLADKLRKVSLKTQLFTEQDVICILVTQKMLRKLSLPNLRLTHALKGALSQHHQLQHVRFCGVDATVELWRGLSTLRIRLTSLSDYNLCAMHGVQSLITDTLVISRQDVKQFMDDDSVDDDTTIIRPRRRVEDNKIAVILEAFGGDITYREAMLATAYVLLRVHHGLLSLHFTSNIMISRIHAEMLVTLNAHVQELQIHGRTSEDVLPTLLTHLPSTVRVVDLYGFGVCDAMLQENMQIAFDVHVRDMRISEFVLLCSSALHPLRFKNARVQGFAWRNRVARMLNLLKGRPCAHTFE